jgi:hypothetical protein
MSISNPLNRQSLSEILKYNIDGCNLEASLKNNHLISKVFTETQKLSALKIGCPMKKVRYMINKLSSNFKYISGRIQTHKLDFQ